MAKSLQRGQPRSITSARKPSAGWAAIACHDIPGFDNAKPIGVGLNDWGKKDPGRLAFEDIKSYLEHHYQIVPSLVDARRQTGARPRWSRSMATRQEDAL